MLRLTIQTGLPLAPQLTRAVAEIRGGGVVGFPTDTLYGLAADPRSAAALDALFLLKGRNADRTVALIAANEDQAISIGEFDHRARRLAARFWPGPLTLVVRARASVAAGARSVSGQVGVRVPDHPVACAFARACGHPLTATSANVSGHPATASPDEVACAMPALPVLIDAGPSPGGPPSTVVDLTSAEVRLVREGALPWSRVLEFLGAPS